MVFRTVTAGFATVFATLLHGQSLIVTATHELDAPRAAEVIEVPWSAITEHFPKPMMDHFRVRRVADGKEIASQVINFGSTAGGVGVRALIFQHDFAAGERSAAFRIEFSENPVAPYPAKVFARYVPERLDDFAWENDLLAHRTYGPALAAPAAHGSNKEVLVSSGLDVWFKRVDYLVIDRWYLKDHEGFDYHHDSGEGLDAYSVGTSRGAGGTGIWDGRQLHVSGNWKSWRVLANGPIRAVFELDYDAWDVGGVQVSEVKRFTVDAGHQFDRVESTFTVKGDASGLTTAIGIAKHNDVPGQLATESKEGWMAFWERYPANGSLGTGVVLEQGKTAGFTEDKANHLLLAKLTSGLSLRYYIGAGWELRGPIASSEEWNTFVAHFSHRIRSPLQLSIAASSSTTATPPVDEDMHPSAVLKVMELVADWQLANPSTHPPTDWSQSTGYTGMMALERISSNPRYRDSMVAMGEQNKWQLGPVFYFADDHAIGQTYAEIYLLLGDPKMIAPLRERFDAILARPYSVPTLEYHPDNPGRKYAWTWVDALFMSPPAWVRLYAATKDKRYLDYAISNWLRTSDYLYEEREHLYFRDSTHFARREANGEKVFWGRGNGWAMAGLARVLGYVPADHPDRGRLVQQFQRTAARLVQCQQPDGLWRASLLDPASYPLKETSGSGLLTFALTWGVNNGLLDREQFIPAVTRAWAALVGSVNPDGKLTHVQPIGSSPKDFDPDSTEVYGVGAFLLAGSEVYRLSQQPIPPNPR